MARFANQLAQAWNSTSWVELLAAVLAVAYLLLAIRQRVSCWLAAFVSSCLYVWVLFGARLYMESGLNAFYAAMAVYGFRQWSEDGGAGMRISRWTLTRNLTGIGAVIVLSLLSSVLLRRFTAAAWPFVDSMVTWASILATFLVARKVYDNWFWWLCIDSVGLVLCFTRGLYVTTLLYALYLLMIVAGMREWRRATEYESQPA